MREASTNKRGYAGVGRSSPKKSSKSGGGGGGGGRSSGATTVLAGKVLNPSAWALRLGIILKAYSRKGELMWLNT